MRRLPAQVVLMAMARFYQPLIVLFAFALLATRPPGGVGFAAGLAFALMLALHALVFGAEAARAAAPPNLTRVVLALGVGAAVVGAGVPLWMYASQVMEAGLFLATASACGLIISAFCGRAPSLRDETW